MTATPVPSRADRPPVVRCATSRAPSATVVVLDGLDLDIARGRVRRAARPHRAPARRRCCARWPASTPASTGEVPHRARAGRRLPGAAAAAVAHACWQNVALGLRGPTPDGARARGARPRSGSTAARTPGRASSPAAQAPARLPCPRARPRARSAAARRAVQRARRAHPRLVHALVIDLWERHRPAVLLVTHDVEEALLLADRVLVIDDGVHRLRRAASSLERPAAPRPPRPRSPGARELLELLGVERPTTVMKRSRCRRSDHSARPAAAVRSCSPAAASPQAGERPRRSPSPRRLLARASRCASASRRTASQLAPRGRPASSTDAAVRDHVVARSPPGRRCSRPRGAGEIDVARRRQRRRRSSPPPPDAGLPRRRARSQYRNQADDSVLVPRARRSSRRPSSSRARRSRVAKGSSAHGLLLDAAEAGRADARRRRARRTSRPADALAAFSSGQVDAWVGLGPVHRAGAGRRARADRRRRRRTSTATSFEIASLQGGSADPMRQPRRSRTSSTRLDRRPSRWAASPPDAVGAGVVAQESGPAARRHQASRCDRAASPTSGRRSTTDDRRTRAAARRRASSAPSVIPRPRPTFADIVDPRVSTRSGGNSMPVTLHWFLPTTRRRARDPRRGTSSARTTRRAGAAPASARRHRLPRPDRPRRPSSSASRASLTPTGSLVRGRVAHHGRADPGDRAAEVPGRVPARAPSRPTLAAQMAATFQRLSGGRLLLNVVTGGDAIEQRRFGDFLDKDDRYARAASSSTSCAAPGAARPFDFDGEHFQVEGAHGARPARPGARRSSSAARRRRRSTVAARHADVYLTWGEPPAQVAEKIDAVRALAASEGRELASASACTSITRDTRRGGVGRGAAAARRRSTRRRSRRRRRSCAQRVGGPAADARAARRARARRPRDLPEPVGRRRPRARRRGHRAGRQPRRGRRPHRRVPRARASTSSSSPAIRTWRRRTTSARACSRSCASAGCSRRRPRRRSSKSAGARRAGRRRPRGGGRGGRAWSARGRAGCGCGRCASGGRGRGARSAALAPEKSKIAVATSSATSPR